MFPDGDLEMLANLCFATNTSTPVLARLKIGFLLREMLDRFEEKIDSRLEPDRNVWIYSAHDSTIASILNSIGLFKVNTYIVMPQFILISDDILLIFSCIVHHTRQAFWSNYTSRIMNIISKYSTERQTVTTYSH